MQSLAEHKFKYMRVARYHIFANHFSNTKLLVKEKIRTSSIDNQPK